MTARDWIPKSWAYWRLFLPVVVLMIATALTAGLAVAAVAAMPTTPRSPVGLSSGGGFGGGAAKPAHNGLTASAPLTGCTGWEVISSTNVVTSTANQLYGAAAVSSNDVWAVGHYVNNIGFFRSLTEHWDGTNWSMVPAPIADVGHNALYTVSAVSSNNVWAFGDYRNAQQLLFALALHWDGSSWVTATIPSPAPNFNTLQGSVALAADDIWVVGVDQVNGTSQPLTEHWNGSTWSVVTAVLTGTNPGLVAVTAFAPNDVWAVGGTCLYANCPGGGYPLIEHWNGSFWSISPSPGPGAFWSYLQGISGTGPDDIWAAGNTCSEFPCVHGQTLVEHWNGSSWMILPSPSPGSFLSWVGPVVALAPNDAWTTGSATNDNTNWFDPMLHWNGSSWTNIAITSPGLVDNDLRAFAKVGPNDIWAVGDIDNGSGELTQIQHYTGPCSTPTPTATTAPTDTDTPVPPTSTKTPVPPTSTNTAVPTDTSTSTPVPPTPTSCTIQFSDVPVGSTFYSYIRCLACRGILNGYPDGTFKPNNNVTRGQLSKIVSNSAGFHDNQTTQLFQDVPPGSTFFQYIGRLASRSYIGGYPCGGTGEPCVPPANLPYFRSNNNATRGQISKIDANAAGFSDAPNGQQFEDVPAGSTYYTYTYRLVSRSIMAGYPCGGTGEPCVPPDNLPYFRPNNNATRGQTSKIVANTFFPNCQTSDSLKR